MSEELLQTRHENLGRYIYLKLGNTTLQQLKKNKYISVNVPKHLATKKPDGLVILPGGTVKALIEYKLPEQLVTDKQIKEAIEQELEVAKLLCNLLIVSDGTKTFWINPHTGQEILRNNKVLDDVFNVYRIVNQEFTLEEKIDFEHLIDQADYSLTAENNHLYEPQVLDPTPLAREVWQKIWISTGKDPEKCLYNFVEIFVFKFLSDIGVLKETSNFQSIYQRKIDAGSEAALMNYANISRKDILKKFPVGDDNTTILSGTIFVNEQGEPNLSQANLFGQVLESFQTYDDNFGSFKYVTKEFKTRLFETFLRQSAGVKKLGQFFTPRNVVRAIIEMINFSSLPENCRIIDPFCGVGGFLLEMILIHEELYNQFIPVNGVVNPKVTLVGYDKGTDEKDDERTIILAKANMLIYFSDILARYHSDKHLKSFSDNAFNNVFKLLRTNLGTFSQISDKPYDLIITNPPYVTSGSSSLKNDIDNNDIFKEYKLLNNEDYYSVGGRGTEALSIEWIVKNLKQSGQAFVVVPDGLLLQEKVIEHIKLYCYVQGIISLPMRTFYSTPKKTYILILKKKSFDSNKKLPVQKHPIFTYLVSEIGETRDAKRFVIEENDLIECVDLFKVFSVNHKELVSSLRQKIITFEEFDNMEHWLIDRLWSDEEKRELNIIEEANVLTEDEFISLFDELKEYMNSVDKMSLGVESNEI